MEENTRYAILHQTRKNIVFQTLIPMVPHHFGELDPGPDHYQYEKPDPDPHHSKKAAAVEAHRGVMEAPATS